MNKNEKRKKFVKSTLVIKILFFEMFNIACCLLTFLSLMFKKVPLPKIISSSLQIFNIYILKKKKKIESNLRFT